MGTTARNRAIDCAGAFVGGLLILAFANAALAQTDARKYEGKIVCGAFSADPKKYPAWNDTMTITINRGALIATPSRSEGQIMTGVVAPSGAVLVAGDGARPGHPPEWTYEFAGQLNPKGPTILRGKLANIAGGGAIRSCALSF